MSQLIAALVIIVILLSILRLLAGRACHETRSVILQVPIDAAWEQVRDFGALQASHGRGRPLLHVDKSELRHGDGRSPGSIWRQEGRWGDAPWWAEIEVIAFEPPRRIEVRLLRDVFGTHTGLTNHRCTIELKPQDPSRTKLVFRMRAHLRGVRLVLARTLSPERMYARLLDLGLRSLKVAIDGRPQVESEPGAATVMTTPIAAPAFAPGTASALPAGASGASPALGQGA